MKPKTAARVRLGTLAALIQLAGIVAGAFVISRLFGSGWWLLGGLNGLFWGLITPGLIRRWFEERDGRLP